MHTWPAWIAWQGNWPPDTAVLVAAVVVIGALAGELIARTTRLPRVVGYTLAGWIAAVGGFGATIPLAITARLLVDMALALLLFEIGSQVRLRWLRHNPGLLLTSLLESLAAALAVYWALSRTGVPPLAACTCAVLAVPASAAISGRVAREIGADGQVTQRMTVLTALNTVYGLLAVLVLTVWTEAARTPNFLAVSATVSVTLLGSLVLAAVLAASVSLITQRLDLRQEGPVLLLLGLVLLAVTVARWLGLSTLLVPLLAGLLLRNLSERAWSWPRHFGTAGGLLVLLLFVVTGSAWTPVTLLAGGMAALCLLAARALAKAVVVGLLAWPAHLSVRKGLALSLTLTPLSATALVTLSELDLANPALGSQVAPIVLSALAIVEIAGPVVVLLALRAAGEVAGRDGGKDAAPDGGREAARDVAREAA